MEVKFKTYSKIPENLALLSIHIGINQLGLLRSNEQSIQEGISFGDRKDDPKENEVILILKFKKKYANF